MSSYVVLARRYRPQTFDEVVGQQHVTSVLTSAIRLKRTAHAYLLAGPRGVGKTTIARVLAKALNCKEGPTDKPCGKCESCTEIASGISVDMIEIDGASNNGIDQIRELREQVRFAPVKGRYKTYIIDEVHMLSNRGFNGLLKTLEEPPSYTVFILATTEPHKIPVTITSRCQRYQLKRLGVQAILAQLQLVVKQEKVEVESSALSLIANHAEGALRDALSLLDQLLSVGKKPLTAQDVSEFLGLMPQEAIARLIRLGLQGQMQEALEHLDDLIEQGHDLHQLSKAWVTHLRYLLLGRLCREPQKFIPLQGDQLAIIVQDAKEFSVEKLVGAMAVLRETESQMRYATQPRIMLETALARLGLVAASPMNAPTRPAPATPTLSISAPRTSIPSAIVNPQSSIPNPKSAIPNRQSQDPKVNEQEAGEPVLTIQSLDDATEDAKIHELWPNVVAAVKAKSMAIYGLLSDSRVIGGDSGSILVEVPGDYHKSALEKMETRRMVEEIVADLLRKPMRLKFQVRGKSSIANHSKPVSPAAPSLQSPIHGLSPSTSLRINSVEGPALSKVEGRDPPSKDSPSPRDPLLDLGMKVFQGRVVPSSEKRK